MSDSDNHNAITDLRTRMLRVEDSLTNVNRVVSESIAAVTKEVSGVIHEIDRRSLEQKDTESDWKTEHALAVSACKNHGAMAKEALSLAKSAHKVASNIGAPVASKKTERIAVSGLAAALIALMSALAAWLNMKG